MNTTTKGTADVGKQRMKVKREVETEYEDDHDQAGSWDEDRKKKGAFPGTGSAKKSSAAGSGGGGGAMRCCQAEKCSVDLSDAKQYHRRHKVCEHHAKAEVVLVGGIRQRFCQQCSRFHELPEFDESKRSCRRRLAGHNERRRKSAAESHMEGSSGKGQLKDLVCGKVDERGRIQITIQENSSYKHFQIR